MTLRDMSRDDFVRELYGLTNGQLKSMMRELDVPAQEEGAKVYLIDAILVHMDFAPLTETEQAYPYPEAPPTKHPLTLRYEKLDSALALADSELYLMRCDLARHHPTDATEHVMMQQLSESLRRIRTSLRKNVRERWSL